MNDQSITVSTSGKSTDLFRGYWSAIRNGAVAFDGNIAIIKGIGHIMDEVEFWDKMNAFVAKFSSYKNVLDVKQGCLRNRKNYLSYESFKRSGGNIIYMLNDTLFPDMDYTIYLPIEFYDELHDLAQRVSFEEDI